MSKHVRADLVVGWHGIGDYLGGTSADSARRLGREAGLPVFKLSPKKVAARPAELDEWIRTKAEQERSAA